MSKQDKEKYVKGTIMSQFEHLPKISVYNSNYYIGYGKDLLFASSDDDDTTEWFLVHGNREPEYLGYSRISNEELLELGELT